MSDECAMILAYYAMGNNKTLAEVEQELEDVVERAQKNELFSDNKPTVETVLYSTAARSALIGV